MLWHQNSKHNLNKTTWHIRCVLTQVIKENLITWRFPLTCSQAITLSDINRKHMTPPWNTLNMILLKYICDVFSNWWLLENKKSLISDKKILNTKIKVLFSLSTIPSKVQHPIDEEYGQKEVNILQQITDSKFTMLHCGTADIWPH